MKTRTKHLTIAISALSLTLFAGAFTVPKTANAALVDVKEEAALFLPESYEQYLPLNDPSDVAMNGSHIAIADGSTIYLYDRANGAYKTYAHQTGVQEQIVTTLDFAEDGTLYFSDQNMQLYRYDYANNKATIIDNIPCVTFLIDGNNLFTATIASSTITAYKYSVSALSWTNNQKLGEIQANSPAPSVSNMTSREGMLYCLVNDKLYHIPTATDENSASPTGIYLRDETGDFIQKLSAICIFEDDLYFSVQGDLNGKDSLYRTDLAGIGNSTDLLADKTASEREDFSALTTYDGSLYCVKGSSIRQMKIQNGQADYTGYVIADGADTFNRISGAKETARGGNLLAVADYENDRVLLYHLINQTFSHISLQGKPTCVATDGTTIAVGVLDGIESSILLYEYGNAEPTYTKTFPSGNEVKGVTLVFGECFYITSNHQYGAIISQKEINRMQTPVAITSDIWGNIYVATTEYNVLKFTETEYLDGYAEGTPVTKGWTLPTNFNALRADFDGNVYYTSGNVLYQNHERVATVNCANLVYHGASQTPVSFALGFEDGRIWYQYGDFIVQAEYDLPALSSINANGVASSVFTAKPSEELSLVDIAKGCTQITVNVNGLTDKTQYLAYETHTRTQENLRGTVLATTEKYSLVAIYRNYAHEIGLFLTENCVEVEADIQEETGVRYLSNAVSFTYYPCFEPSLTQATLPRGSKLTVLSTVDGGNEYGFPFAYVSYTSNGATANGYVPLAYLTEFPPIPETTDDYQLGKLKANATGVEFRNANGDVLRVTEEIQVKVYDTQDGYLVAKFVDENGIEYHAQITSEQLVSGASEALRTGLIIVLCVIAVGLLTGYAILVYLRKRKDRE